MQSLKRYVYIPKLAVSFLLSIAAWTLFGATLNFTIFFTYAGHQVFEGCTWRQPFTSPCGWGLLKTALLLIGFPFVYFLVGKMWALVKVVTVLIEQHSEDFVALMRPMLMKTASTVDQKVNPKAVQGVKAFNDRIDQAPWLIGYIFKSLKGEFVQSVIEGKVDLKSETEVDAAMTMALREYAAEKRSEMWWITGGLVGLNLLTYWALIAFAPSKPQPGLNVFYDFFGGACHVMTLEGTMVGHLPGRFCLFLPDDQYFSVLEKPTLFDKEFNIVWTKTDIKHHHEAFYDTDRDWIWLLGERSADLFSHTSVLHDQVLALDRKTGRVEFSWNIADHKDDLEQLTARKWEVVYRDNMRSNIFSHLNSISVLPRGQKWHGGEVLLSENYQNLIFTLDIETKKVTWFKAIGEPMGQHSAQFVGPEEIIIFINNAGKSLMKSASDYSAIASLQADQKEFQIRYKPQPTDPIFSEYYGHVQLLPNSNLLISHVSNGGAAIEVDSSGKKVWSWTNREKDEAGRPRWIYRMVRLPEELVAPYVKRFSAAPF